MKNALNVLIEKLFGKILDDIGDKFFNFYRKITSQQPFLYEQFINLPYVRYGEGKCYYGKCYNLKHRNELLQKIEYKNFFNKLNFFNKKQLAKKFIDNFEIMCWNDCDKFIISLIVLFDSLFKKDINKIYMRHRDNKQANIYGFFREIQSIKPKLIDKNLESLILAKDVLIRKT